jgi:hypothetical protein
MRILEPDTMPAWAALDLEGEAILEAVTTALRPAPPEP